MGKPILSIIVCTFNRCRLLEKCLHSLVDQMVVGVEVIVVDNNSTDMTKQIVDKFQIQINNLTYQLESKVGLSHARNRGINEAKGEWILYIDDDAIAFDDMVNRALYLCNLNEYDCIGGMYYGYFEGERPKWIDPKYGTKSLYSTELQSCPFDIPHGGIVLYKKITILEVGGFNLKYGMTKNKIQYGEEIELQKRIEEIDGKIAFDPKLRIKHLNKSSRLSIMSFLLVNYELGKSHRIKIIKSKPKSIFLFIKALFGSIIRIPISGIKLIIRKKFYWQNFILEILSPISYALGNI